jgi:hypothetical protein
MLVDEEGLISQAHVRLRGLPHVIEMGHSWYGCIEHNKINN